MAVYTSLSSDEIKQFLRLYDLPPLDRAEGIRAGIENTNYLIFLADGTRYIFTVFEKRVTARDMPFFTGLMEHIAKKGFPAPLPLHAKDGSMVQTVKGKPATLVTFLSGNGATDITESHMRALGRCAANLHNATAGYNLSRPNSLSLAGWKALTQKISGQADAISPGLSRELQDELSFFTLMWPDNLPAGVIHADLFPDNVFFDPQAKVTGVIDFYFACNEFFAYELAICINAWCFSADWKFNPVKAQLLLDSYETKRPLSQAEREALPLLSRGAAFRFLLTRTHDWIFRSEGALVTPKDPLEYLTKLRFFRDMKQRF